MSRAREGTGAGIRDGRKLLRIWLVPWTARLLVRCNGERTSEGMLPWGRMGSWSRCVLFVGREMTAVARVCDWEAT